MSIAPPHRPDFHICDPIYGSGLLHSDCISASMHPSLRGSQPITYHVYGSTNGYSIPFTVNSRNCYITVDVAGPTKPLAVRAPPDTFLGLALWVIARCVVLGGGLGGFTTLNMRNIIDYSTDVNNLVTSPYPSSTAFYTVTVGDRASINTKPGDTDPAIPMEISGYNLIHDQFSILPFNSLERRFWRYQTHYYDIQSLASMRGSSRTWFARAISAAEDTMTYECDARLGHPAAEDCSHIRWDQLKPGGDTLALQPGKGVFLHQNTCTLAITATVALTLTWAQIQTALSALLGLCVENPSQDTPQGGRAFYSPPPPPLNPPQRSGKQRREGKRDGELSGLNALPPHANITIFQQKGTYQDNAAVEEKTCAWDAVLKGKSIIQACGGG